MKSFNYILYGSIVALILLVVIVFRSVYLRNKESFILTQPPSIRIPINEPVRISSQDTSRVQSQGPQPATPIQSSPQPATPIQSSPQPATPIQSGPQPATPIQSGPQPATPIQSNLPQTTSVTASLLPSFMDSNRLMLPLTEDELFQYKVFHIGIISCAIKGSVNEKIKNKQTSFKQIYTTTLQQMGIEPRMFERNLDTYMDAVQRYSDRTWKEVFDSTSFLNAVTENIEYFLSNPSQAKLNDKNLPIGTIENVRKPVLDEKTFVDSYEKCKARLNSLEFYSPISFTSRLYD